MSAPRPVVPDELPTPSRPSRAVPLDRLPVGSTATIVEVAPHHRAELASEGIVDGRAIEVTGRAPFRGPVLVRVGRARLALSRDVASEIRVR